MQNMIMTKHPSTISHSTGSCFLTMGVIPAIIVWHCTEYRIADFGLTIIPHTIGYTIAWTAGLSLLVIPLAYFSDPKTW